MDGVPNEPTKPLTPFPIFPKLLHTDMAIHVTIFLVQCEDHPLTAIIFIGSQLTLVFGAGASDVMSQAKPGADVCRLPH